MRPNLTRQFLPFESVQERRGAPQPLCPESSDRIFLRDIFNLEFRERLLDQASERLNAELLRRRMAGRKIRNAEFHGFKGRVLPDFAREIKVASERCGNA